MCKLFITFLLVIITNNSFSQSKASASASVTIETSSVGITASVDSGFSAFTITPRTGLKANFKKANKLNGLQENDHEIVQLASFDLVGDYQVYDVTLPSSEIISSGKIGKETIKLSSFTFTSPHKTTVSDEVRSFSINTTLTIPPLASAGEYVPETPVTIILNLN